MTHLEGRRELDNGRFYFQFSVKLRIFGSIVNLAFFTCEVKMAASVSLVFVRLTGIIHVKRLTQNRGLNNTHRILAIIM